MPSVAFIRNIHDIRNYEFRRLVGAPPADIPARNTLDSVIGSALNQELASEWATFTAADTKPCQEHYESEGFLTFDPQELYARFKWIDTYPNNHGSVRRVAMKLLRGEGVRCGEQLCKISSNARASSIGGIRTSIGAQGLVFLAIWLDMSPSRKRGSSSNCETATTPSFSRARTVIAVGDEGHRRVPDDDLTGSHPNFNAEEAGELR